MKKTQDINPAFVEELDIILQKIKESVVNLNYNDLKGLKVYIKPSYKPLTK
jgi:hypothetical protein